jgi:hypothetical protein
MTRSIIIGRTEAASLRMSEVVRQIQNRYTDTGCDCYRKVHTYALDYIGKEIPDAAAARNLIQVMIGDKVDLHCPARSFGAARR